MSGDSPPATFSASTARVTGIASRCLESLHFHFGARAIFPWGWMARSAAVGRPAWVVPPFVEPTIPRVSILHTCGGDTGSCDGSARCPRRECVCPASGWPILWLAACPTFRFVSTPPPSSRFSLRGTSGNRWRLYSLGRPFRGGSYCSERSGAWSVCVGPFRRVALASFPLCPLPSTHCKSIPGTSLLVCSVAALYPHPAHLLDCIATQGVRCEVPL